ncbi:MAG TPA: peptide deformylase [Candidatus Absconditabacterales bacterium]|nr:peptide deformylase [Candidatus Absconditabacterales bacterium]HRU50440.1 peptide deformylase [Candidatus Absconditabacterales bacterium]
MINLKKFYPIQTGLDNKILRKKSKKIDSIDQDILEFAEILMELMYEYDGVGLAAPQIGRNIRMIAITYWKETKKGHERIDEDIMINPEIIEKSNEMLVSEEACLSVPDVIGKVKRHQNIVVEYLDIFGRKKKKKLRNYNACIVQHEIDHLDAILFVDKLIK